jgi:hypothetical protein
VGSKYGSSAFAFLLADGYDLRAAKLKGVTFGDEVITEQTDGLGDSSEEHTPVGMTRATFSQTGALFDDATNGMHLALRSNTTTARILSFATQGNTIGQPFTGALGGLKTKYDVLVTIGALTKANASYSIQGALDDGVILQTHVQQTIDWTNTAVDNGASSAAGGVGYLHVSQFAGLTGFVGLIEDSADGATDWTAIVTFTNVTSAPTAQRIAIAGTVRRHIRFRGDVTGSGTITPFAGFVRG